MGVDRVMCWFDRRKLSELVFNGCFLSRRRRYSKLLRVREEVESLYVYEFIKGFN